MAIDRVACERVVRPRQSRVLHVRRTFLARVPFARDSLHFSSGLRIVRALRKSASPREPNAAYLATASVVATVPEIGKEKKKGANSSIHAST